jgi:hypothetical protein
MNGQISEASAPIRAAVAGWNASNMPTCGTRSSETRPIAGAGRPNCQTNRQAATQNTKAGRDGSGSSAGSVAPSATTASVPTTAT